MELRLKERQKLFKDYRAARQSVLQQRNSDREERNEAKVKQLEIAETWQVRTVQFPVACRPHCLIVRHNFGCKRSLSLWSHYKPKSQV